MLKDVFTKVRSTFQTVKPGSLKSIIFLVLIFFSCILASVEAQWQPDVRLTNNNAVSNTNFNNARCIDARGDSVHVVWHDERDGNAEIYYKRSTDRGTNWSGDMRLTNSPGISWGPSESVSGSVIHLVWEEYRDGNAEIYYKRSSDAGISWGVDIRLTNDPASSFVPTLSVSGSIVHVVWHDLRHGAREIFYKRSSDAGINWGADTRLTNNPTQSRQPCVSVSGTIVHVVWQDDPEGNVEIYYKRSTDGGVSWEANRRLTINTAFSVAPSVSVSVSGPAVNVLWSDNRDGDFEIYYKGSLDGGINWGVDTRLTSNSGDSWDPVSYSSAEDKLHVAWYDQRDGNSEIYYKRSLDGGMNWDADVRLTNNPAISEWPSVAISGSVLHTVWFDERDGNPEIYYKRDPTGNLVAIALYLTTNIEGFYDATSDKMVKDTVRAYLRNSTSPYSILDSAKSYLDSNGKCVVNFLKASNELPYYLVLKHRNSIETWSKLPVLFSSYTLVYDFTTSANKAYGDNLILKGSEYCIYSGDVNQDAFIDGTDFGLTDNDAFNSAGGYIRTDVNGDFFVDGSDLSIVDNNAFNFVSVISP